MKLTASFKMIPRLSSDLVIGKPVKYLNKKIGEIINFNVEDEKVMVTIRLYAQNKELLRQLVEESPTHIDVQSGEVRTPLRKAR